MLPHEVRDAGAQIILGGNTYHMIRQPGMSVIQASGGMHRFMGWAGPMLIDSGGYQMFSLGARSGQLVADEAGARFAGTQLTPEMSLEAERVLAPDIVMPLDYCTPSGLSRTEAERAMHLTHEWLRRTIELHDSYGRLSVYGTRQALFGIAQGGGFDDLTEESVRHIGRQGVDGLALGGEVIGYDMPETVRLLRHLAPLIPSQLPRYTMGVGSRPEDALRVTAAGADLFDCVAPTRNARHGSLYAGRLEETEDGWLQWKPEGDGVLRLSRQEYTKDDRPISETCGCSTCARHSRAYLRFLLKEKDPAFRPLSSIHNTFTMHAVCSAIRQCIMSNAEELPTAGNGL
jgi:queuine tRNA-ribosyltransferase